MAFTRNPSTVGDLLASTLEKYADELQEQWYKKSVVANKFLSGKGVKDVDGGESIVLRANYQNSGTVQQITRASALPTTQQQMYTTSSLLWAGLAGSIARNDWDIALNSGSPKAFDLFEQDLKNLQEEMAQTLEGILVGAVTVSTSSIWSLLDVIDSSNPGVGNYAGLDRSSYTWWAATETAVTGGLANVIEALRTAHNTASRNGMDPVDFCVTTQTIQEAIAARHTAYLQISSGDKADLMFPSIIFNGRPVFYSDQMLADTLLGVNLSHTKLYVAKQMKMKMSAPLRTPSGQDEVRHVRSIMQVVCYRPASNFKLTGLS